jgi:hypothetical protein
MNVHLLVGKERQRHWHTPCNCCQEWKPFQPLYEGSDGFPGHIYVCDACKDLTQAVTLSEAVEAMS